MRGTRIETRSQIGRVNARVGGTINAPRAARRVQPPHVSYRRTLVMTSQQHVNGRRLEVLTQF